MKQRDIQEKGHLRKGHSESLAVNEKTAEFEHYQNISDMMTQWCDRLQEIKCNQRHFSLQGGLVLQKHEWSRQWLQTGLGF